MFRNLSVQSSKRRLSPERDQPEVKRQKRGGQASDTKIEEEEEEDEEERLAEEKLKQLQELAEKSLSDRVSHSQPSSSSSLSSSKGCLKSSWQQIGNLMYYTAAGVKGSNKVGTPSIHPPIHSFITRGQSGKIRKAREEIKETSIVLVVKLRME